jgi:rubrerythrin
MEQEIRHIINSAIAKEIETYEIYVKLINKFKEAEYVNLRAIFNNLAIEELKHEALLKEILNGKTFRSAKNIMQERYDLDLNIISKLNPTVEITHVRAAIEFGIQREREAKEFYKRQYDEVKDDNIRDVFKFLITEETNHESLLSDELRKL